MTVTYRNAGPWGSGKGSNLTPAEVDGNFWDVVQAIANFTAPDAVSIADIVVTGNAFTVVLTDDTELGPFTLPIAGITARGDWANSTAYARNDIVRDADTGNLYMTLQPHTSAASPATFDPDLIISSANAWRLLIDAEEIAAFAATLVDIPDSPGFVQPPADDISSTSLTLALADAFKCLSFSNAATVTIPADAAVAFPVGTVIAIRQDGAGTVTINAASAAFLDYPDTAGAIPLETRGNGAVIFLMKTHTNTWRAWGDFATDWSYAPSGSATLVRSQNDLYFRNTVSTGKTLTIGTQAAQNYPRNFQAHVAQMSTGQWTIAAASGVTLNSYAVTPLKTRTQGSVVTVRKVADDIWDVFGDIEGA